MGEPRLIQRARQGNLEAFNCLIPACQDLVFQHAIWMMGEPELAEDVTQETFLLAYHKLRSFQSGDFRCWLLRIANRICLEELHRRESHPSPLRKKKDGDVDDDTEVGRTDRKVSPEGNASQEDLEMIIREGLKKLLPDLRAMVILVDLLDFDYRQASEILGISFESAKSRLARARVQIQDGIFASSSRGH